MPRASQSVASRRRRKKVLRAAKGYWGGRSKLLRVARDATRRAMVDAYAHRRTRKREFRRLWIIRINAAARAYGLSYSALMAAMRNADVEIDRKMLADLAVRDEAAFRELVERVVAHSA